jgi:hypothetical protein
MSSGGELSIIRSYAGFDAYASYDACYDLLYDDLLDVFFYGVNRAQFVSV